VQGGDTGEVEQEEASKKQRKSAGKNLRAPLFM
jgi:hypothetical protein